MPLFALVLLTLCSCTDTPPPYQAPGTARMAERLATGPIPSIRAIKRAVRAGQSSDLSTSLDIGASNYGILAMGEDHHEAVDAFLEKRAPNFEGTSS